MPPQAAVRRDLPKLAASTAFAALRGMPRAKTAACLADPAAATKLVQMNSDAVVAISRLQRHPDLHDQRQDGRQRSPPVWKLLEPKLREALGG